MVMVVGVRNMTVLLGFVGSYLEASWEEQVTKEWLAERTIRVVVHAKHTLMATVPQVANIQSSCLVCAAFALG